jgi:hypothetical protein
MVVTLFMRVVRLTRAHERELHVIALLAGLRNVPHRQL